MCDAYMMCRAIHVDIDKVNKTLEETSHHKFDIQNTTTNIKRIEKVIPYNKIKKKE